MIYLVGQTLQAFGKLFPKGKHRNRAIFLALIATIVPLSQLFVIRIFSHMILHGGEETLQEIIFNFVLFFTLFGVSHLATYWQKTYRVKVFNDALNSREGQRSKVTESWEWALAFETNNLLHTFAQVVVLSTFFIIVNWQAGLVNVALILFTMIFIKMMFKKQIETQEDFAMKQKRKESVTNFDKIRVRVKSAELSTLIANAAFILSLAALLALSYGQAIAAADAIMLFLGFRMQNSNLTQTSGSLMRFARAKAQSESAQKFKDLRLEEDF